VLKRQERIGITIYENGVIWRSPIPLLCREPKGAHSEKINVADLNAQVLDRDGKLVEVPHSNVRPRPRQRIAKVSE